MSYFDDFDDPALDNISYTYQEWKTLMNESKKYEHVFWWLRGIYEFEKNADPQVFEWKRMNDNLLQVVCVMKGGARVSFGFWDTKDMVDRVQRLFQEDAWQLSVVTAMKILDAKREE